MSINKFKEAKEYIEELHKKLWYAHSHFIIWETFEKHTAPNIVGEEVAEYNVKKLNKLKEFVVFTIDSHRHIFSLELAKMFDKNPKSLSIYKIIDFIRLNIKYMTKENFKEINKNRKLVDELVNNYDGISEKILKEIEEKILNNNKKIKRLKKFRNQKLAHNQIEKGNQSLIVTIGDVKDLFNLCQNILNELSNKLDRTSFFF